MPGFASIRRHVSIPLVWACLVAVPGVAAGLEVRYDDTGLSVRIERVPLDDVLSAVASETGITIEGEPLDRRDVSKRFDGVPLGRALTRIVGRQNFILWYGADGKPERLELLGAPLAAAKPTTTRRRNVQALRLLLSQPPVALASRAARALGGDRLPVHRVLRGLAHDEAMVREDAARAIVGSIERNPALLAAVRDLDPGELSQFVSSQAGAHALDAAGRLYRAASDPGLKAKMATVAATLRRTVA